ncbi:isochorismate synthase [Erwinia psidii]|uniref:isochorismate synthase n=1 Tax=Erwinia psidii TaxID=69224 RepID=A0A3N6UUE6_9GAMM|nr:isochorismate synthase [Erwinia psidii]MCX8959516.1 isochorismate synthase [Erwinia psidii]MCX8963163.1 isochorismate synthase [Erwinia psidii]RQM36475.1 isochorismate synthase [Erwinia psidii]
MTICNKVGAGCLPVSPGAESFLFTSCWKSLVTEGRLISVETPASQGDKLEGAFQQAVRSAFAAARATGMVRPLLVGAIPFDTRQPSALFIPRHSYFFNRRQWQPAGIPNGGQWPPEATEQRALPEKAAFMAMVAKAAQATARPGLDKVVLSRLIEITTAQPLHPAAVVHRLVALNPGCYHFYLPLADGSSLLGASPELLLRKSGHHFSSLPLAGSAPRDLTSLQQDHDIGARLMRSQKDRFEHQLVTQAMRQLLQPRSLSLDISQQPTLITTPTLWHLATQIEGEVRSEQENALSLACLLHPTPALSGHPHVAARQWITQLEPFDRQLFGGIVGWCDEAGNGEWVVTIRCATLAGNRIRLFAGAGIVPASEPEAEWNETGTKLSTMLKVFGLR